MENNSSGGIDYKVLSAQGLQLSEENFNLILNALSEGVKEAMDYLKVDSSSDWPRFNFSNEIATLGYSSADDAICMSISHLNQAVERSTPIEFKDQLIMFIPDVFYIVVKYVYWLRLLGRESTIHRYQRVGSPTLKVKFPDKFPAILSMKQLLLCDIEVEARGVADAIANEKGERSIWKSVDAYFSNKFPEFYNKRLEELTQMPKPDFPISYEMEYCIV